MRGSVTDDLPVFGQTLSKFNVFFHEFASQLKIIESNLPDDRRFHHGHIGTPRVTDQVNHLSRIKKKSSN